MEYTSKNGRVEISRKIIPPKHISTRAYRNYFMNPKDEYVYIEVETQDSKLYKLYAWICHINYLFTKKMLDYVMVRDGITSAYESIRQYLDYYGITESEYAHHNAYRNWMRSKEYKQLKRKKQQNEHQQTLGG